MKVEGLKVVYQRSILPLDGTDLDVPKGTVVPLLGANGVGKSTTLRAIPGFMGGDSARITAGSIRYGGEELRHLRLPATTRRGIGLVPERDKVFPNLTVEENLSVVVSSAPRVELQRIEEAVFTYFPRIAGLRKRAAGLLSGSAEALKSNPRVQSSTWAAAATAIPIWKAPSVAGRSASMPCVSAAWWCSTRSRSASPRASCWR
ncbi:ATP-binding cassette domain-containing protein [Bradyrhizobium manausense]|uniref:ATP-binding cassette domain-containing protein n=1 Tax=Bradyrhizobium manausense TaxID=989370 RepID=UPI001BA7990D|nr:ATP-binding cassette domain-containing protein [Bradyrhizobium manausense]MBR1087711.1 ATP-binding cassette domain-containing protein [Bradyrhizobium manausense]